MRAIDGTSFLNIAATTADFYLDGGKYGIDMTATGSGTVKLQKRTGDNTTYVSVSTATDMAATPAYATVDIPAGYYHFTIGGFTAIYINIRRIPGE